MKIVSNTTASIAGITAALSFVAEQAEAAVVIYTPTTPFILNVSGSLDPDSNMASGSILYAVTFCGGSIFETATFSPVGNYELAFNMTNPLVDPGLNYNHSDFAAGVSSSLVASNSKYILDEQLFWGIGIRDVGSTGDFRLGWLEFSDSSTDSGRMRTLYRWGFEDTPGVSITIPQPIPEPSSLLLFGLGSLGMLSHRRRTR